MNSHIKINQVKVPSFVNKTTYVCDICGEISGSESAANWHYAEEHSAKETIWAGGAQFVRFENEEQFQAWVCGWYRHLGEWTGPGWYWVDTCDDYDGDSVSICHPIADYLKQVEQKKKEIAEVEEFVKSHIDTK